MWKTQIWSLGWKDPLEKGRATHSSIPAWRIPRTEGSEPVHGVTKSQTWLKRLSTYAHNDRHNQTRYYLLMFSCSVVSEPFAAQGLSLPGSSVRGIFQARILERVAISLSRGSSQPRDWTHISCTGSRFFTTEPPETLFIQPLKSLKEITWVDIFVLSVLLIKLDCFKRV